jgi:hypothetical protein
LDPASFFFKEGDHGVEARGRRGFEDHGLGDAGQDYPETARVQHKRGIRKKEVALGIKGIA